MKEESGKNANSVRICQFVSAAVAFTASVILGLSISRLLFEGLFPQWLWTSKPAIAFLLAAVFGLFGLLIWVFISRRETSDSGGLDPETRQGDGRSVPDSSCSRFAAAALPYLPFYLNALFLFESSSSLLQGRFLFLTSIWLAALMILGFLVKSRYRAWFGGGLILLFFLPVYLLTMGQTVGTADTFEFQVVVPRLGIAHPTGYPLYLLLSKPFTWLPINEMAWRVNLATMIFGLGAVIMIYLLLWRLSRLLIPATMAAVVFGLTPTFWSQAIEAEVYSLNAFIVGASLLLMLEIGGWQLGESHGDEDQAVNGKRTLLLSIGLAAVLGAGLSNHLTTILLLPAAVLSLVLAYRDERFSGSGWRLTRTIVVLMAAFLLPLALYAYLPIRWSAVNGEAMGVQRFVDWVIGGRFQGALQLDAWLNERERYEIVGRLIFSEFPWLWFLPAALLGLAWLFIRRWQYALILFASGFGYFFYALNYHVPDLAVFIIPLFAILVICWAVGLGALTSLLTRFTLRRDKGVDGDGFWKAANQTLSAFIPLLLFAPFLFTAAEETWTEVDASTENDLVQWAEAVLALPLEPNATILADSTKFPPLFYIQQTENMRPDVDILLLPDEAAYRSELDSRLSRGKPVYLARFLPGLEGLYHLRSLGPLVEVSQSGVESLPEDVLETDLSLGSINLIGYQLASPSPFNAQEAAVTLYWSSDSSNEEVLHLFTRLSGQEYQGPEMGQHAASNYYPTIAWQPGEVVADYRSLPLPAINQFGKLSLEAAVAPPFSDPDSLEWHTVATFTPASSEKTVDLSPRFIQVGTAHIDGAFYPKVLQTGQENLVLLSGQGSTAGELDLSLESIDISPTQSQRFHYLIEGSPLDGDSFPAVYSIQPNLAPGSYELIVSHPNQSAQCGWMAGKSDDCSLGIVTVGGAQLPPGALNFEGQIALLSSNVSSNELQPGGILNVDITWQALAPMEEDYTVFVQVLDENDQIVGQTDSWPLQGTYPTSAWEPGERVDDSYALQLESDLQPGQYKIYLGWYLLETLERLAMLDESGRAVDDKFVISDLFVR